MSDKSEGATTDAFNKLQMDFDSLMAVNGKLLQNVDSLMRDNDTNKKKWATTEKQLRAALTARKANQCERDEQIELLKAHVNTRTEDCSPRRAEQPIQAKATC